MRSAKPGFQKFNVIVSGVGGQGLITLLKIISEAALSFRYDVKTSELHGLSQRGGSVEVHIRFGKKRYFYTKLADPSYFSAPAVKRYGAGISSPLIPRGRADLILALESQEALGAGSFASKYSTFLINKYQTPTLAQSLSEEKIIQNLSKISRQVYLLPAAEICQKEVGTAVTAGIYLLGYASFKGLIPLKPQAFLKAIKKIIPKKYLELNLKTFNLAKLYEK